MRVLSNIKFLVSCIRAFKDARLEKTMIPTLSQP